MDTVVSRVMKVPADAYKMVTTARKPSDNVRVLSAAKALPKHRLVVLAMGELGLSHARALAGLRRRVHLCRAHVRRRHRRRPGERALPAPSLPRRKAREVGQDLRRDRRPDPPLDFARGAQSRVSVAARGCGVSAVPGLAGVPARFLLAGGQAAARRLQRHHSRTSRRSSATWTWWIRWRAASARSTRCGARPASGAAPIPTPPASPARSRACCVCRNPRC